MERKYLFSAVKIGAAYGGLFLLCGILKFVLLPDLDILIIPLLLILTPFLLSGITVVFTRKMKEKLTDTLIAGGISGAVIGFLEFITLMIITTLTDLQMNGEYTSSNGGLFLIGYCCALGSASVIIIGSIAGAFVAACTVIVLKIFRSLNAR